MSPFQLALLGVVGGSLFGLLLFWARIARAKRVREAEARTARIEGVVDRYRAAAQQRIDMNLSGMLAAGVLGLRDGEEVEEALAEIDRLGLSPGIPRRFCDALAGTDLLLFFRRLHENPRSAKSNAGVLGLIEDVKEEPLA
jgi:hypothetical protein